ncbi:MAG: bifunctional hydroxymethylpyrimidine kinase/phosphomethylpyrimidine kinase [Deltaproteobacteria bacterium]|nr:bifunctional hydroxymethylpyrimidine kinase/phosphomethylpyrimidine kinase [Deltaproteobacteria bacterium]
MTQTKHSHPVVLTIAGSDSGGGAGIQADLKTFQARGVYGTSAITAITAQNPSGVRQVSAVGGAMVQAQIETVAGYFTLGAAKTGMLLDEATIRATAKAWQSVGQGIPLVVDPVMAATSGAALLEERAVSALVEVLFPLARVVTPNLDEAAMLTGKPVNNRETMEWAAQEITKMSGGAVLLKGGHLPGDELADLLWQPGCEPRWMVSSRIHGVNTHGTGCALSAAIAAGMAQGQPLAQAVENARTWLQGALRHGLRMGGDVFLNHGWKDHRGNK